MGTDQAQLPAKIAICETDQNGRILNCDHISRSSRLPSFRQPMGVSQLSLLSELKVGESAVLVALDLPESVQNHLMHMGFVPDALVTALRRAPAGDPTVYAVDGMEIALRHETAEAIRVRPVEPEGALAEAAESADAEAPELLEATR